MHFVRVSARIYGHAAKSLIFLLPSLCGGLLSASVTDQGNTVITGFAFPRTYMRAWDHLFAANALPNRHASPSNAHM